MNFSIRTFCDKYDLGWKVEGCDYSHNDRTRYEASLARLVTSSNPAYT
jgi:hypothetical protein